MVTLELKSLSKVYGSGETQLTILENASFTLKAGEVVALVAPSGTGKSTLLHIAGLLDSPTTGDVLLMGESSAKLTDVEKASLRNKYLGFVYQQHHLLPEFTSLENIMMPMLIGQKNINQTTERAYFLLECLGLKKRADHRPTQLSGGEQQRVAFLRALSNNPSVLLADEPTGNLDLETGQIVFQEILKLVKETKLSCLIATHNQDLAKKMDRIITLSNKHCVEITL